MRKTVENIGENEEELLFESKGATYRREKRRVRKGDIIAFILSVLAAVFLWFYVMAVESPNTEVTLEGVKVAMTGEYELRAEKGWSLISQNSLTVDVVLRGKKSLLNRMTGEDVGAYVDLAKIETAGKNELKVEYKLPDGVTCLSEKTVQVEVDELVEVRVPVEAAPPINFSYKKDYVIGDPVCNLSELTVSGPAREVAKVAKARAIVDLENQVLSEPFSAAVTPVLCDSENHVIQSSYLRLGAEQVSITVPVYLYKTVDLAVTYKYGHFTGENVKVSITPASIRIFGDPSAVESISSINLGEIDETSIYDDISKNMAITLPSGVSAAGGEAFAIVELQHVGTKVKTVTVKNITVTGGEGKNYRILEQSLDISLRCNTDIYNSVDASCITASIDLGTVGSDLEGQIKKTVTVNVTDKVMGNAYPLGEYSVTVELLPPATSEDSSSEIQ